MHNNRNNRETVIIPQTIIVPTKSIIVASLVGCNNEYSRHHLLPASELLKTQRINVTFALKGMRLCSRESFVIQ